jgi:hypothetical protein
VNVTLLAFPEISTLDLSFLVDFVLLFKWIDPRQGLIKHKDIKPFVSIPFKHIGRKISRQ